MATRVFVGIKFFPEIHQNRISSFRKDVLKKKLTHRRMHYGHRAMTLACWPNGAKNPGNKASENTVGEKQQMVEERVE